MKISMKMPVALAALVVAHAAHAVDGYSHPVTIALTESVEGEENVSQSVSSKTVNGVETSTTTTNSSNKIVASKIGNKEVLEKLLDLGAFPPAVRSITGYSIQLLLDQNGDAVGLYAIKAGVTPVSIDAFLTVDYGLGISSGSAKTVVTVKGADETTVASDAFKDTDLIAIQLTDGEVDGATLVAVQGIANTTGKGAFNDTKDPVIDLTTISSISASNLTGATQDEDDNVSIFQGSFKVAAGKKIELPDDQ